ncbi:GAD-like domain-containing protein [Vibrio harveyi]|uniref:GAD-like domain-containing protein n=1 Tax=Vibrio harveyi TaxID=669 RepID=UPI0021634D0B|nr:GAD-like domain-containing protein [Vibrio harveyi]
MFRWIAAHYVELNKLNDEYFEMFIEEFGEPTEHIQATDQQVEAYRGILPDQLLKYWHTLTSAYAANHMKSLRTHDILVG